MMKKKLFVIDCKYMWDIRLLCGLFVSLRVFFVDSSAGETFCSLILF